MVPMYHLITLNHMMATICKIIISPIFPITFFVCLAVRARARGRLFWWRRPWKIITRTPLGSLVRRSAALALSEETTIVCELRVSRSNSLPTHWHSFFMHAIDPTPKITPYEAQKIVRVRITWEQLKHLQGWANEWALCCVNPASGLPLAAGGEFTQPRARSFAQD